MVKFVNKCFWDEKIIEIPNLSIDNITDFSYSTCFSYFILPLDVNLRFGSVEFNNYVKGQSEVNCVMLLISAIAPYAVIKYLSYSYENDVVNLVEDFSPYNEESKKIGDSILGFLNNNGITSIDLDMLNTEVEDIKRDRSYRI